MLPRGDFMVMGGHGHQLVDSQRFHDPRVYPSPRSLLYAQTIHIRHTPDPQLGMSNAGL